ncbi:MAG: site-specific integrase [Chloroflexi bacterium]|nr:site-specific integrase [Chloroflexota bacterium]
MTASGDRPQSSTNLVAVTPRLPRLNKSAQRQAIVRAQVAESGYVPHLGLAEVTAIAEAAGSSGRHQDRDRLLVQTLFDACLRISEALRVRPRDIKQDPTGWHLEIFGKGKKPGIAAISSSLAAQLQAYAYRHGLNIEEQFFPITRTRAFQIVDAAMAKAGVTKPDHVGAVHILRHSGAIERLRVTGNPKAVQDQLRHTTARMTLRYFKTLQAEESLRVQQGVDFGW